MADGRSERGFFENVVVLAAGGFIAGEALARGCHSWTRLSGIPSLTEHLFGVESFSMVEGPVGGCLALGVFLLVTFALIRDPLQGCQEFLACRRFDRRHAEL